MIELLRYFDPADQDRQPESPPASEAEIDRTYKRYHGLMMTYCGPIPEPNQLPDADENPGYFTMWHEPLTFIIDTQQPIMEMSLTSWQIPLPKGWTRGSEAPLIVPDDVGMQFNVSLRRFLDLFSYKEAHYNFQQHEILWDVGTEIPFAATTPATSIDCQKLGLLADLFERAQGPRRLPTG